MNNAKETYYWPFWMTAVMTAAVVAARFLPGARLWGINHLLYLPDGLASALILCAVITLLLSHPRAGGWVERLQTQYIPSSWRAAAGPVLFLAAVGMILWVFRSATTLLGDGSLVLREGVGGSPNFRAPLTWLIMRSLNSLLSIFGADNPVTAYHLTSMGAGLGTAVASWWFGGVIGRAGGSRFFWISFTLSSGAVVLFAGYVENYSLFWAGAYLYLLLGIRSL
ncbi:hypothetical protein ACFLT7_01590, partial [candidate division KSB1 bacterium]